MFNNPYNSFPYTTRMIPNAINDHALGGVGSFGNNIGGIGSVARTIARGGFFKSLANIKWGTILNNTQKTLNVINQAIPVYYQIKPICSNLKSFGKIMSAFNDQSDNTNSNNNLNTNTNINNLNRNSNSNEIIEKKENSQNLPTFFIN